MAVGDGVKLIDVGAVMRIDDHQAAIFGTPGFQAPEVATAGPSVASDLYTVGRTLAVLIIRFVFHEGAYLYALPGPAEAPLFAQWESLYRFLLRATAYHPDDRFQSAPEMAEQLTGVLREIVALTEGRARPTASQLFEGDRLPELLVAGQDGLRRHGGRLAGRAGGPGRRGRPGRGLPARPARRRPGPGRRVDHPGPRQRPGGPLPRGVAPPGLGADPARAHLPALPPGALPPVGGPGRSTAGPAGAAAPVSADPERILREVELANPWEWRVHWYRAIHQLQSGQPAPAGRGVQPGLDRAARRDRAEAGGGPGGRAGRRAPPGPRAVRAGHRGRLVVRLGRLRPGPLQLAPPGPRRCRGRLPPGADQLGRPRQRPGGGGPGPGGRGPGRRSRSRRPPGCVGDDRAAPARRRPAGLAGRRHLRPGPGRGGLGPDPQRVGLDARPPADREVAAGGPRADVPDPGPPGLLAGGAGAVGRPGQLGAARSLF